MFLLSLISDLHLTAFASFLLHYMYVNIINGTRSPCQGVHLVAMLAWHIFSLPSPVGAFDGIGPLIEVGRPQGGRQADKIGGQSRLKL